MKEFSAEEKAEIQTRATKDFQGRTLGIWLDDPINQAIVCAPYDRKSYSEFNDAEDRDPQTAHTLALARAVYPDELAIHHATQAWPVLAEKVSHAMQREAGSFLGFPVCERLAELPPGLAPEEAKRLRDEAGGKLLWSVATKDGSFRCVLRSTDAASWIAARAAYDDAKRRGKGSIEAIDPYVLSAVAWSSEPVATALDLRPGLIWVLWLAYKIMGGDAATVRTFRL